MLVCVLGILHKLVPLRATLKNEQGKITDTIDYSNGKKKLKITMAWNPDYQHDTS
jgi:hypothetical protein